MKTIEITIQTNGVYETILIEDVNAEKIENIKKRIEYALTQEHDLIIPSSESKDFYISKEIIETSIITLEIK